MAEKEMSMKEILDFMKRAEKRREMDTAALIEKLGNIHILQEELMGSWKPKVDQALGDLTNTVNFLKERVEEINWQVTTAVARSGQGAVEHNSATVVARAGHGVVNRVQQQPVLLTDPLHGIRRGNISPNGHRLRLENWGAHLRPPGNGTTVTPEPQVVVARVLDFDAVERG
jgi:hypothetical protein